MTEEIEMKENIKKRLNSIELPEPTMLMNDDVFRREFSNKVFSAFDLNNNDKIEYDEFSMLA